MENNINNNIESKNLWTDFKLLIVSILDIRTGAEKTQTAEEIKKNIDFQGSQCLDFDILNNHSIYWSKCQFYRCDNRSHAYISTHGTNHGYWIFYRCKMTSIHSKKVFITL